MLLRFVAILCFVLVCPLLYPAIGHVPCKNVFLQTAYAGNSAAGVLHNMARGVFTEGVLEMEALLEEDIRNVRLAAQQKPVWSAGGAGLEYLVLGKASNPLVLARIHPDKYNFVLCMASEQGRAMSFKDWGESQGLKLAINASMFLPDERTSTGYMQNATHSNNDHIGSRLGAFLVAEPFDPQVKPRVAIIETSEDGWRQRIQQYAIRVQNYRLLTREGNVPWDKESRRNSIAAIGQEKDGHIVFMVSVLPLTVSEFGDIIRRVLPELENTVYVEGSAKVGMYLHGDSKEYIWQGRKSLVYTPAPPDTLIPNVIGIRPR